MDFRIGCWLIGVGQKNINHGGPPVFKLQKKIGQFLLINWGGIINPHLTLLVYYCKSFFNSCKIFIRFIHEITSLLIRQTQEFPWNLDVHFVKQDAELLISLLRVQAATLIFEPYPKVVPVMFRSRFLCLNPNAWRLNQLL